MSSNISDDSTELFNYDDKDLISVYSYSKKILNKSVAQIISEYEVYPYKFREDFKNKIPIINTNPENLIVKYENKGQFGNLIEQCFYGYKPNNKKFADFPDIPLEIKVTPYTLPKSKKNNTKETEIELKAKERLILGIINYKEDNFDSFETSTLYTKCKNILILFYNASPQDFNNRTVDYIGFYNWFQKDLKTIEKDFGIISKKILEGKAHELSESDTFWLAATVKGKNRNTIREQRLGDIKAKQRCWSLKSSYIKFLLNNYFKNFQHEEELRKYGYKSELANTTSDFESIIKSKKDKQKSFDDVIVEKLTPYFDRNLDELIKTFNIKPNAKHKANLVIKKIFKLNNEIELTEEFQKANMLLRVIRVDSNNLPKEDSPYKVVKFNTLNKEENWEKSHVYTEIFQKRIMFVILKETEKNSNQYVLKNVFFWGFPDDLEEKLKSDWKEVRKSLKNFVITQKNTAKGSIAITNFPKSIDCNVIFYKIHSSHSVYEISKNIIIGKAEHINSNNVVNPLPDKRRISNHSFWLPKKFLQKIINQNEKKLADT